MGHFSKAAAMAGQVRVHAAFTVKDEASFLAAAKKMVDATQEEKGCVHYQLYKDVDTGEFAMIETWETEDDLKAHSTAPHIKQFGQAMKDNVTVKVHKFTAAKIYNKVVK